MITLHHALSYVRLGMSVIPVPAPDDRWDGKTAAIPWATYQKRFPTRAELEGWFHTQSRQNMAVVTGPLSGIVVIDGDSSAAVLWWVRRFPYTPWQTRTRNGFHLWYRHPGLAIRNRTRIQSDGGRLRIDVRADGGYVIAANSVHASGVTYVEAGDWSAPRERVPVFRLGWLAAPNQPRSRPLTPRPTGDVVDRARAYLAAVPMPQIGGGSDVATLSAACHLVRGFALSAEDAARLLWEWAGERPGWTLEWIFEKVANAERYGREPIGGLR